MAGKRNIVESWLQSWLEVLARVLARRPGSTPSSHTGSSPGLLYRHPHIFICMYVYINKARPRYTTLGASSILFFKYIRSLIAH